MIVCSLKFYSVYFQINVCAYTDIRIQIVLLMVKFESPIVVTRKMQVESRIKTRDLDCISDVCDNEPLSNVRAVATACFITRTTAHSIMTEYLPMKAYKV